MSKKKSSGNTMTLKDFHGGSIPSDLPLPSAPGVVPRSATDRSGFDRPASMGRPDQRTRPSSSHSIRNFDDKTPFLPQTANIGRYFSEDERKPLDGPLAPRRMVSDDVFQAPNTLVEVKSDSVLGGRHTSWQGMAGSWPLKKIGAANSGTGNQMVGANIENSMSGAYPNAWASRREVTPPSGEPGQYPWVTQPAVSKLINVTAAEQVSSGRWHSKLVAPSQIENLKHSDFEDGLYKTNDHALDRGVVARERESSDVMLSRHMEKDRGIEDDILGGRKVSPECEKGPAPAYLEVKDGNTAVSSNNNKLYPNRSDARHGVPSETVERPKLKLLPRTKPLENVEKPLSDAKQESGTSIVVQRGETGNMSQKSMNTLKPSSYADESGNQHAERPKLHLKPISQLLEQPAVNPERERNAVFGGARPRELVLKERGVDETAHHESEQPERVKLNVPKTERIPEQAIQPRQAERPGNVSREMRTGRVDKKDNNRSVGNADRSEAQRRNWRSNNNNSVRENERQQPQHPAQEKRHPSPETWRKPVETQKPESLDGGGNGNGQRYGKAASALELAQAFSKPFSSDPRSGNNSGFNNVQRGGVSGRNQAPFSRLIGSTPQRQINGY